MSDPSLQVVFTFLVFRFVCRLFAVCLYILGLIQCTYLTIRFCYIM